MNNVEKPTNKSIKRRRHKGGKHRDRDLSWLEKDYPHLFPSLSPWKTLASKWSEGNSTRLTSLIRFFEHYLIALDLPLELSIFFDENTVLPDFYRTTDTQAGTAASYTNSLHRFLDFVLLECFSKQAIDGTPTILPGYRNPIARVTCKGELFTPQRLFDNGLLWIERKYPHLFPELSQWRDICVQWLSTEIRARDGINSAIALFFERYLIPNNLPLDPHIFLDRNAALPDFYKTACTQSLHGVGCNNRIHRFMNYVMLHYLHDPISSATSMVSIKYRNPIPLLSWRVSTNEASLKRHKPKKSDASLSWLEQDHPTRFPGLSQWRDIAAEWLSTQVRGVPVRLHSLILFFERYIIAHDLPLTPQEFLARSTVLPDFWESVCSKALNGIQVNNCVHDFLEFVLLKTCSEEDDNGRSVILPIFSNPVPRMSSNGLVEQNETVYSPLPYGYIDEMRHILAPGSDFRNWTFAHGALGVEIGQRGKVAVDWFPIAESSIDMNDPDCVWRVRKTRTGQRIVEMWSPVRWMALFVKLNLPLRTYQVRVLDSGEADTWRYEKSSWVPNTNKLAEGSKRAPLQQGVFRRVPPQNGHQTESTALYINTNKTADSRKSGMQKGYVMAWIVDAPRHQDVFYWLEKLRNWQEKYNPIPRKTSWSEVNGSHIALKSDVQLAGYPDACFLFRFAEGHNNDRSMPISANILDRAWACLLEELEARLALRGEKHQNGDRICFFPDPDNKTSRYQTLYPLHSLRVSLITALALEGQVPFHILQKLVGHSRLLMTLYYTKPGYQHIREVLHNAAELLEKNKESSIQNFLLNSEFNSLLQSAACNNIEGLVVAIPQHPASRNAAGWMLMHHGVCLVGGNTSEIEGNNNIGGCFNGGPIVGDPSRNMRGPVPGGSRNCVRCRWFVTHPGYISALCAQFNNIAYHFDESRNACLTSETNLHNLKKQKADAEENGGLFQRAQNLRQSERLYEKAMKEFSDYAEDLVACYRLIERCVDTLRTSQESATQLVAVGSLSDVQIAFEETESELLQLAGVCEDAEIYPDLSPGKAVFRRSQLLDNVLYREDLKPIFMFLDEKEQLLFGNAFMRDLARRINPSNPLLGKREVIRLIDGGVSLSTYFGVDLATMLPPAKLPPAILKLEPAVTGEESERRD